MDKILFAPLTKVVEQADGTLEIWGRAAAQEADPKGEVFDYEASKPFIKNWSEEIAKASGGQSLGNLRAMHNPRLAAGKLTALTFNDAEQTVDVVAKVVDPGEDKRCRRGSIPASLSAAPTAPSARWATWCITPRCLRSSPWPTIP